MPFSIQELKKEFARIYDPKTAFGNKELIYILEKAQELQKWMDETITCTKCEGEGEVDHDCECDLCRTDTEECMDCNGEGRIYPNK